MPAALKAHVEQMGARSRPSIHITLAAGDVHLSDEAAMAVFRITQEALNNAIQHANASEIEVRLTNYPDHLRLTVTDDGRGIAGGVDAGRFVAQGILGWRVCAWWKTGSADRTRLWHSSGVGITVLARQRRSWGRGRHRDPDIQYNRFYYTRY